MICRCLSVVVELGTMPDTESVSRLGLRITAADSVEGVVNWAESSSLPPDPNSRQLEQKVSDGGTLINCRAGCLSDFINVATVIKAARTCCTTCS